MASSALGSSLGLVKGTSHLAFLPQSLTQVPAGPQGFFEITLSVHVRWEVAPFLLTFPQSSGRRHCLQVASRFPTASPERGRPRPWGPGFARCVRRGSAAGSGARPNSPRPSRRPLPKSAGQEGGAEVGACAGLGRWAGTWAGRAPGRDADGAAQQAVAGEGLWRAPSRDGQTQESAERPGHRGPGRPGRGEGPPRDRGAGSQGPGGRGMGAVGRIRTSRISWEAALLLPPLTPPPFPIPDWAPRGAPLPALPALPWDGQGSGLRLSASVYLSPMPHPPARGGPRLSET